MLAVLYTKINARGTSGDMNRKSFCVITCFPCDLLCFVLQYHSVEY